MKIIAILGASTDFHAERVKHELEKRGATVVIFATDSFPELSQISWKPDSSTGALRCSKLGTINFRDIHSVYWRMIAPPRIRASIGEHEMFVAQNDSSSLLQTFLKEQSIRWVNGYSAYDFHRVKPLQLSLASELGVPIPKTLISAHP